MMKRLTLVLIFILPSISGAQTTAFNYQWRPPDGGNAANGSFQMLFKRFPLRPVGPEVC